MGYNSSTARSHLRISQEESRNTHGSLANVLVSRSLEQRAEEWGMSVLDDYTWRCPGLGSS